MPDRVMTRPDIGFVKDLKAAGGDSLKKCYQCATCSVVCKLSPDDRPYPRKEMIWAQWGQRAKLVSDPDVWLCHQCNDCSTSCPRGARPGDVMAAIRSFAVEHYSVPSFPGRMVRDPGYVLLALAVPIVLVLSAHYLANGQLLFEPTGEIHFSEFLPHLWVNLFFSFFVLAAFLCGIAGVLRFWQDMKRRRPGSPKVPILNAALATFVELALHGKFRKCGTSTRTWTHLLIFYGFIGLFIVTGIVVIMLLVAPGSYPINTLGHPLKIAGNAAGVLLLAGCALAMYNRLSDPDTAGASSYFDWFFLLILACVGLTGFLAEIARFAGIRDWAYPTYFVHLVFNFALLVYLPYSKFAHILYRFAAITYAKHIGLAAGDARAGTRA